MWPSACLMIRTFRNGSIVSYSPSFMWNPSSLDFLSIANVSSTYLIHGRGSRVSKASALSCSMTTSASTSEGVDQIGVPLTCLYVFPSLSISPPDSMRPSLILSCSISATSAGMCVNDDVVSNETINCSVFSLRFLICLRKVAVLSAPVVYPQEPERILA